VKKIIGVLMVCLLLAGLSEAQQNYLITSNSAGDVRLGMTIAQARKALKGVDMSKYRSGDGLVMIQVIKKGKDVMHLFTGEEDSESKINEKAKIEFIEVFDANYKTVEGIRPTMLIKNAEKILGKIDRVFVSEIEAREFVIFKRKPKGLAFHVQVERETGKYMYAGIYPDGKREGTRCVPTAYILGIQISKDW
jgi:hypothetical protein